MWQVASCALLLLCITPMTSGAAGCSADGPETCKFQTECGEQTLCSWSSVGFELIFNYSVWQLEFNSSWETGNLTSRTACSTGGQKHCLRFAYVFDLDDVVQLSVSVRNSTGDKGESLLWRLSSNDGSGWHEASVSISTNNNFSVTFRAKRLCRQHSNKNSVRIDRLRYENTSNSCIVKPPTASPEYASATRSPYNNTNSSSATTKKTTALDKTTATPYFNTGSSTGKHQQTHTSTSKTVTKSTLTAHSSVTFSNSGVQSSHTTNIGTDSLPPESNEDEHAESPNKVEIIVSIVVGVTVVTAVIVLLIVLCSRKRRNTRKANNTRQNSNLPQQATPTQPIDHRAIIVRHEDSTVATESAMPEYAVVNKQRKVKQEIPPQSPHKMGDQSAQQHSQSSERNEVTEQEMKNKGGYDNYSLARIRDPPTASSSVYQVPHGDTATLSQGQGKEYNVLDFKRDCFAMEDNWVQGESEGAASAVYNHLNEGDQDTYNEVDRQNRPEVLGDQYSHIQ